MRRRPKLKRYTFSIDVTVEAHSAWAVREVKDGLADSVPKGRRWMLNGETYEVKKATAGAVRLAR